MVILRYNYSPLYCLILYISIGYTIKNIVLYVYLPKTQAFGKIKIVDYQDPIKIYLSYLNLSIIYIIHLNFNGSEPLEFKLYSVEKSFPNKSNTFKVQ